MVCNTTTLENFLCVFEINVYYSFARGALYFQLLFVSLSYIMQWEKAEILSSLQRKFIHMFMLYRSNTSLFQVFILLRRLQKQPLRHTIATPPTREDDSVGPKSFKFHAWILPIAPYSQFFEQSKSHVQVWCQYIWKNSFLTERGSKYLGEKVYDLIGPQS